MTTNRVRLGIALCWIVGGLVGITPLADVFSKSFNGFVHAVVLLEFI